MRSENCNFACKCSPIAASELSLFPCVIANHKNHTMRGRKGRFKLSEPNSCPEPISLAHTISTPSKFLLFVACAALLLSLPTDRWETTQTWQNSVFSVQGNYSKVILLFPILSVSSHVCLILLERFPSPSPSRPCHCPVVRWIMDNWIMEGDQVSLIIH